MAEDGRGARVRLAAALAVVAGPFLARASWPAAAGRRRHAGELAEGVGGELALEPPPAETLVPLVKVDAVFARVGVGKLAVPDLVAAGLPTHEPRLDAPLDGKQARKISLGHE